MTAPVEMESRTYWARSWFTRASARRSPTPQSDPDGASVARAAVDQDGLGHLLPADRAGVLEGAVAEVAGRQDPAGLEGQQGAGTPERVKAVLRAVVVLAEPGERAARSVLVHGERRLRAANDDGLEALGAHHGAEPAAAVEVLELVHDRREANAPLARHAGLEHADPLVPQLLLETVLHFPREPPPVGARVPELHLAVLDPEIDRRLRLPADHEAVVAGSAQLGSPPPAGLGLAVAAGQRRLGRRRVAVSPGEREPVDHARGEDQDVVGTQGIHPRRHVPEEEVARQRPTAQVLAQEGLGEFLDAGLAAGEIDMQQLAGHP